MPATPLSSLLWHWARCCRAKSLHLHRFNLANTQHTRLYWPSPFSLLRDARNSTVRAVVPIKHCGVVFWNSTSPVEPPLFLGHSKVDLRHVTRAPSANQAFQFMFARKITKVFGASLVQHPSDPIRRFADSGAKYGHLRLTSNFPLFSVVHGVFRHENPFAQLHGRRVFWFIAMADD